MPLPRNPGVKMIVPVGIRVGPKASAVKSFSNEYCNDGIGIQVDEFPWAMKKPAGQAR
jgi:hypothetical protein